MAFASTCGSLLSNLIGAGDAKFVSATIRQHIRIAYLFVIPTALLFALFPEWILGVYTDIPDLQQAAVHTLWVMCATYFVQVPATVYFVSVSGTGNTRTALVQELITITVYVIYITYIILYLKLDIVFAWTAELVYSLILLLLCYRYIKRGRWQMRKI